MANESTAQQQDNSFLLNLLAMCTNNNNTPQTSTSNVTLPTPSRSWFFDMNTESKVPAPVPATSSIPQQKPTAEFESSQPNQTVPASITTPLPSPPSSFHSSTPPYMKPDHPQPHPRMNNQQKWQKKRKGNFQNRHHTAGESTHGSNRNDFNGYDSSSKKRQRYEASPAHTSSASMSPMSSIPTSSASKSSQFNNERLYNTPRDPRQRHPHAQRERFMDIRQPHPSTSASTSIQGSRYSSPEQRKTTNVVHKPENGSAESEEPLCSFISVGNCNKSNCPFRHEGDTIQLVCRHFKTNSCSKGAECTFLHDLSAEPCRFFHLGNCKLGDRCPYSHETPLTRELLVRLRSLTENCKYYHEKGYCTNGDECLFIH